MGGGGVARAPVLGLCFYIHVNWGSARPPTRVWEMLGPVAAHLRSLLSEGVGSSCLVLFLSCVVRCCSCRVFVCVTCFSSYVNWGQPVTQIRLYKIFFLFKTLLWESIILVSPHPTCKAYPIAILVHDHWAIYALLPTPLLYAVHHTILVMAMQYRVEAETRTAFVCIFRFSCGVVGGHHRWPVPFIRRLQGLFARRLLRPLFILRRVIRGHTLTTG